jgi:hypothetical protein
LTLDSTGPARHSHYRQKFCLFEWYFRLIIAGHGIDRLLPHKGGSAKKRQRESQGERAIDGIFFDGLNDIVS